MGSGRAWRTLMVAVGAAALQAAAAPTARIFIASDSTAQDYKAARYPQSGWGTMLRCAVDSEVVIENRAIGGRSTKSFIAEGRLDALARDMKPGDTLLIQFGHNDANTARPERYAPIPEYETNLARFIAVARMTGVRPVLLTPVMRRSFVGERVSPSFPAYSAAAKRVAAREHVPLIDLATLSEAWLDGVGPEQARAFYLHYSGTAGLPGFPKGVDDDTHFSELGARRVADLVAGGLAQLPLPVAAHVLADRPALRRAVPAGGPACR